MNVFDPELFLLGKSFLVTILLQHPLLTHGNPLLSLRLQLVNVHVVIYFDPLPLTPELRLLSYSDPGLHELEVRVQIVSPLPNFGLAHELQAIFLLQEIILPIIHRLLLDVLESKVDLVRK